VLYARDRAAAASMIRRRPAATETRGSPFEVADAQGSEHRPRTSSPACAILQVGRRRAEIAALKVGDLHRDPLAINPQTAARIRTISSLLYADRPRAKCVEEMKGANVPPIRRG